MTPDDPLDVRFDVTSEADGDALLDLYRAYWTANDVLRNEMLDGVYSTDEDAIFFNTNGHVYNGLTDWLNIWDYYRPRMRMLDSARGGTVRVIARDDLGVIIDDHVVRSYEWKAEEDEPNFVRGNPNVRMTFVCKREPAGWRISHVHFSERATDLRPDQSAKQG